MKVNRFQLFHLPDVWNSRLWQKIAPVNEGLIFRVGAGNTNESRTKIRWAYNIIKILYRCVRRNQLFLTRSKEYSNPTWRNKQSIPYSWKTTHIEVTSSLWSFSWTKNTSLKQQTPTPASRHIGNWLGKYMRKAVWRNGDPIFGWKAIEMKWEREKEKRVSWSKKSWFSIKKNN